MKNATTVLADAPTTTLKIAYSYLVKGGETSAKAAPKPGVATPKVSPYKTLFVVNPIVNTAATWGEEWYANYE